MEGLAEGCKNKCTLGCVKGCLLGCPEAANLVVTTIDSMVGKRAALKACVLVAPTVGSKALRARLIGGDICGLSRWLATRLSEGCIEELLEG